MPAVNFAIDRPAEFRAMFAAGIDEENFPELAAAAKSAFGRLVEKGERAIAAGAVVGRDAQTVATTVWATAHGLAMLAVEDVATQVPAQLVEDALSTVVAGMGARPAYAEQLVLMPEPGPDRAVRERLG
jgi:dihydropteroate synthase